MAGEDESAFAELIAALTRCQAQARELGLDFLPDLIGAAAIEAALQWDGGRRALAAEPDRLDALLRMKLRIATARSGRNIVHLRPSP